MNCPYCGNVLKPGLNRCPECGQQLREIVDEPAVKPRLIDRRPVRALFFFLCALVTVFVVGAAIYKLYFWKVDYDTSRLYERGDLTPVVNQITLSDGRPAHTINFFGDDGGQVYIPELGYSTYISGRVGRVEIPDNTWFSGDLTDVESAVVSLTPVIIEENGDRIQLPAMEMVVDPPQSPITVISPAEEDLSVSTSIYPLEIQVVPGSTVLINGEDATEFVDRAGLLSKNVNVYPVGDNVYTILVRTPNHKETRVEVVIYRAQLDIEIELDTSVSNESSSSTMLITGKTEPGAMITVDTEHLPESVYIDMETGKFSFMAKFATIGENIVRFHASMEGREDASISMTVEYVPTLAEYSKSAWKMDYTQLRRLFEQWKGRVFLCEGEIVHVFVDGDDQYCIMDVGTDEQQWIVLLNESGIGSPTVGREYSAYADVQGRYLYEANYYPLLTARYMDLKKAE
ncbi:MAG TPA: zinc ribbon domain-containing protein [Candidatus Pullichristensenella excrementigallinarum]|uniref:Zinc ribbon domain-containing protein n=1 Tax=Candidatus Pullichristensenella excrementigallinarum TaxID=2840907 RepID=A0A9D1LC93_9FIRM|nr:zinc ribbon domain-containing protein [Candidatus Pullichristensenella excrementigallinarum]